MPISAPGGSPDPSVLACVGFSPTCGLLRWKPNISSPSAPCLLTPREGFLPSLLVGRVLVDRTCLEIPQVKASCHQPPTPLFYFIFFHRSELGRTLAVRPEVSPGGGRFGAARAKTSRVARQKKKKETERKRRRPSCCASEILEVPLRLWHPPGSGSAVETWQGVCLVSAS